MTELRRTTGTCASLFLLCALSGFVLASSFDLSKYLANLFQDVNLGVDMILLPKGITPETMQKSLINGEPEALMPLALFETLQKQILEEMGRKNLDAVPLRIMGILPYHAASGAVEIATIGDQDIIRNLNTTMWQQYPMKNLNDVQSLLIPKEKYSTDEWKDKTLFAVLVVGAKDVIASLKQLIDRRTIAQAYYLNPNETTTAAKLKKLNSGLRYLAGIILLSVILGMWISFQKLAIQRKIIFQSLQELQVNPKIKYELYLYQVLVLVFVPITLGLGFSFLVLPLIKNLF